MNKILLSIISVLFSMILHGQVNELSVLQNFLKESNAKGVTNAEHLGISNLSDPSIWPDITWDGHNFISIRWHKKNLTGELNLSGFQELRELNLSNNYLLSLTVNDCPNLQMADVSDNDLQELDFSNCNLLKELFCNNNRLTTLNVQNCSSLENLDCSFNQLPSLSLFGVNGLVYLNCENNNITDLSVTDLRGLQTILCANNNMAQLLLLGCGNLSYLDCSGNQLYNLNVDDVPNLIKIDCAWNNLSYIDLSNRYALTQVMCNDNNLQVLDLSNCPNLVYLNCENNELAQVILTGDNALYNYNNFPPSMPGDFGPVPFSAPDFNPPPTHFRNTGNRIPTAKNNTFDKKTLNHQPVVRSFGKMKQARWGKQR